MGQWQSRVNGVLRTALGLDGMPQAVAAEDMAVVVAAGGKTVIGTGLVPSRPPGDYGAFRERTVRAAGGGGGDPVPTLAPKRVKAKPA